jgi:ABC-2 type transport system permease protein
MQMALLSGYLPSMLLSGFIFSIPDMPDVWQYFTMLFPARWYMTVCRACYLKDPNFADLLPCFGAMLFITIVLLVLVTRRFTGRLD